MVVQESGSVFECRSYVRYDGIRVGGDAITVSYETNAYPWRQVHDPETGQLLAAGDSTRRTLLGLSPTTGTIEIVQGYPFGSDDDGEMIVMERTIVTANPGSTVIDLTLDPS